MEPRALEGTQELTPHPSTRGRQRAREEADEPLDGVGDDLDDERGLLVDALAAAAGAEAGAAHRHLPRLALPLRPGHAWMMSPSRVKDGKREKQEEGETVVAGVAGGPAADAARVDGAGGGVGGEVADVGGGVALAFLPVQLAAPESARLQARSSLRPSRIPDKREKGRALRALGGSGIAARCSVAASCPPGTPARSAGTPSDLAFAFLGEGLVFPFRKRKEGD